MRFSSRRSRRRTGALTAALLTSGFLVVARPAHAQFGANLIVNPGAEAGAGSPTGAVVAVPGWTTANNFTVGTYANSSGFPTASDPGPGDRGANFFAGGPATASSSAFQVIDVSAGAAFIDLGGSTYNLSGWLGGFGGQNDSATLTITFRDLSTATVGTAAIGPILDVNRGGATGLLLQSVSGAVPVGTRTILTTLNMNRTAGSYNDGYADSLSLVLTGPAAPGAVPEPGTSALLAGGLLPLAGMLRRRKTR